MVANPLPANTRIGACENVKAEFEPVAEAMRNFECFVQLVLGGVLSVDDRFAAFECEVAVKLEHGGAGIDKIGSVDLDLVTALRMKQPEGSGG